MCFRLQYHAYIISHNIKYLACLACELAHYLNKLKCWLGSLEKSERANKLWVFFLSGSSYEF
jgi:hypothetical protein